MSLSFVFSRLSVALVKKTATLQAARSISLNSQLNFQPTQCLYREPLRKKKKMDPGMLKAREEKRKRKLEREIRRLERLSLTLKPIEEMQLPLHIQDQREQRERGHLVITQEEEEQRILLLKKWSTYRLEQHTADLKMLDRINYSQQLALDKLREESEELYQAAIQVDAALIPLTIKGPSVTPPIKEYDSPDGDYTNTSFKWE